MQQGASPRLLSQLLGDVSPGMAESSSGAESGDDGRKKAWWKLMQQGTGAGMQGFAMPAADVLRRSEFLLPQDDATREWCWQALHTKWEQTYL